MKRYLVIAVAAFAMATMILNPATAFGQVIVDDSWADGGRNNGVDPLDTDWWTSTSSQAIEVGSGFLGLVSGTSGRGIHGTFAPQTLAIGDTLTATFTFTTPATVTSTGAGGANFKIGLFDTTAHNLAQDVTTSTSALYTNLNGYMLDYDVSPTTSSTNINFRQRSDPTVNTLLSSTTGYTTIGSAGGNPYSFAPNTSYTGVFSLTRTGSDSLDLSGSLYQGNTLLSTWSQSDSSGIVSTFGAIGFHVNANIFGSTATPNTVDNGIDFTNIKIEVIPEPSALVLSLMGLAGMLLGYVYRRC
ncbi:MAG TPA: hypothetical protein VLZ12_08905 [Verrucomicrobiae bacterium]|nr:hypothetical protein [Verrucomicrobiae bacterium]